MRPVHVALAAGALLVVLLLAFLAGRQTAVSPTPTPGVGVSSLSPQATLATASPTVTVATSSPSPAVSIPTPPPPSSPIPVTTDRADLSKTVSTRAVGQLTGEWAFTIRRSLDSETQGQQIVLSDRAHDTLTLAPLDGRAFDGRSRDIVHFVSALGGGGPSPNNLVGAQLSPDGRQVVLSVGIERSAGGRRLGLVVVDISTGAIRQLTTDPAYHDDTPAWHPDGTLIAFSRQVVSGGDAGIWLIRPDGTELRNVTGRSSQVGARSSIYSWSADGRYIAFALGTSYHLVDVVLGRFETFGEHFFVIRENADWRRSSPQFVGSFSEGPRGGAQRIAVADAPGARPRSVVTVSADASAFLLSPRWRPGSDDFLYRQSPSATGGGAPTDTRMLVANAAGGTPRQVLAKPFPFHAEWTPDGTEIAWIEDRGVAVSIRVVRVDGTGERIIYATGGAPEASVTTIDFGTLRL